MAYWSVLVAAVLPYVTVGFAKAQGRYDNRDPRAPGTYRGLAYRAHSAHQNGLEAFPFFAVAVLVASAGSPHAPIRPLDTLAVVWIVLRLLYVVAYLSDRPSLRSAVWIIGFFVSVAIFTMPAWPR